MRAQRFLALFQPLRKSKLKFAALAALACTAVLVAQDDFESMTPNVARVGERLACRCGGCKFTVGNCNMPRCGYSIPKRKQIADMQSAGMADDAIVDHFVKAEGVVTLSTPPTTSLGGLISWAMPGIMLLLGFWVYLRYVRGRQAQPVPLTDKDEALIERYKSHMDVE
jgi:cytochrome c-type biogenesis protein CcmH/NrfF